MFILDAMISVGIIFASFNFCKLLDSCVLSRLSSLDRTLIISFVLPPFVVVIFGVLWIL